MGKLCQIIAVEKGLKSKAYDELKTYHKELKKPAQLEGFSRTYAPFSDTQEERLPPELKHVQLKAADAIEHTVKVLTEAFDITATKEWGNTIARADIIVDGKLLLADVPVGVLLFLEHQLDDLTTFIGSLPTLDPAESWTYDENQACFATAPATTQRTRKTPTVITKAEPTQFHPAQTEIFMEDKAIGQFTVVKRSGALTATRVNVLKDRVTKLRIAVKFAREEANTIEVENRHIGATILNNLFA